MSTMRHQPTHDSTRSGDATCRSGGGALRRRGGLVLLLAVAAAAVACARAARSRTADDRVDESEDYEAENAALLWAAGPETPAGTREGTARDAGTA